MFDINESRVWWSDIQLCERIVCLNQGVCANRNPSGPAESVCLCRYGTTGDYCQLIGKKLKLSKVFRILKNSN